jgi:hypothetical protein
MGEELELVSVYKEERAKTEEEVAPGQGIQLAIDLEGRPFARPYYARVPHSQEIRWSFPGPWVVHFGCRTPLPGGQKVVRGFGSGPPVAFNPEARGHFSYSIAVAGLEGITPTIFLDVACPEVIVF